MAQSIKLFQSELPTSLYHTRLQRGRGRVDDQAKAMQLKHRGETCFLPIDSTHARTHTNTHTHTNTLAYTRTRTHTHTNTHTLTHTYTHKQTHTYTHILTHLKRKRGDVDDLAQATQHLLACAICSHTALNHHYTTAAAAA
jgi:hypothetical protein